ncbi:unnamed protein product [Ceutorhynchus assimilis]|uniref:Uncharacterized protein n=1 Tax=Ceutorhynchus assimilis TaxID=467358 RepID=A0A9N9N0J3_9CUCU|nr:unnamed protein product [Ceutorhynchus assimilis]
MFTRGIRGGDWESYRGALSDMLPYIALYDHGNYLKSLSVHIADLNQLPLEVEAGFHSGDFAVLKTKKKFSQVELDHAQETQISEQTYSMFSKASSTLCHKEETGSRRSRDLHDEDAILQLMETYNLGSTERCCTVLSNVATKDIATTKISEALLTAKQRGAELVQNFARQRLVQNPENGKFLVNYHATLHKNNALTLGDLYKEMPTQASNTKQVMDTDRDFLRILIAACKGGRKIDLKKILKHELCKVRVSLATAYGELRTAEKASLVKEILMGIECQSKLSFAKNDSILMIDGMAFVLSLGRPQLA